MGDSRWPQRILTRWPKGRKRREIPALKWERERKNVMKQKALTPEDAVNRQIRPKASKNQLTGIKDHPITDYEDPKVE
jgi:hypothetical protein